MKSNLKNLAFVPALLLAFAPSFASATEMPCCPGHKAMMGDMKTLSVNAKTAEEHAKLACHFRREARAEAAKATYHEEMAKLNASSSNEKHDVVAHCKQFANEARKAADLDNRLAAEHEQIASQVK